MYSRMRRLGGFWGQGRALGGGCVVSKQAKYAQALEKVKRQFESTYVLSDATGKTHFRAAYPTHQE